MVQNEDEVLKLDLDSIEVVCRSHGMKYMYLHVGEEAGALEH